ncbi:hypothetical protein GVN20_26555 [Runella sp. CRIBMP]|uniref:hypothetical protein n=1 Tax=Runella sp. CRIBMP TaxID=2683261 RepID=UPI00141274BC|nr:hypothetical protein [Runella sp. CRIBMP]NBB22946.1 hypothetical protein [Runella sp. CRIBMP]
MFETPILLIIFNRPNAAQLVFEQIKKVKPKYLFVAADGPRPDRTDDVQKCNATREIIKQIDWRCDLQTLFREENRGCGYGPAEAITWFFEHVEQGIILEDDCLADTSFFHFCEVLLEKYKDNEKLFMISGTNPLTNWRNEKYSYIFSKNGFNWGWATWQRAWKHFDYNATQWGTDDGKKRVKMFLKNDTYYNHFSSEFDNYFKDIRRDVWDFQWLFCRFYHGGYSIVPTKNLISNVGFNENATHTFYDNDLLSNLPAGKVDFPLINPKFRINNFFDWVVFERFINPKKRTLVKRVALKLIKILSK